MEEKNERTADSEKMPQPSAAQEAICCQRDENVRLLETYGKKIKPCRCLIKDVEKYVLGNYSTQQLPVDEIDLTLAAMNIAAEIHKNELANWQSPDETDAKLRDFMAHDPSPVVRRYLIKEQGIGQMLYAAQKEEHTKMEKEIFQWRERSGNTIGEMIEYKRQPIIVEFELHTGSMRVENSSLLYHELIVYRGVSANDIEKNTPDFLQYLQSMKALGILK